MGVMKLQRTSFLFGSMHERERIMRTKNQQIVFICLNRIVVTTSYLSILIWCRRTLTTLHVATHISRSCLLSRAFKSFILFTESEWNYDYSAKCIECSEHSNFGQFSVYGTIMRSILAAIEMINESENQGLIYVLGIFLTSQQKCF